MKMSALPKSWKKAPNKSRRRMSGNNISLKVGNCGMPLLGAYCRYGCVLASRSFAAVW